MHIDKKNSYLKKSNVIVTSWMMIFRERDNPTKLNTLLMFINSTSSALVFSNVTMQTINSIIKVIISANQQKNII